jgi:hypothetical protein
MSAVTSHSWALVTGMVTVTLLHATPLPDGTEGHSGDVVSLEANVANILVGSGMAEYTGPWGTKTAPGQMFRTGERKPYVPAPAPAAPAPAAAAPAPAHAKK